MTIEKGTVFNDLNTKRHERDLKQITDFKNYKEAEAKKIQDERAQLE